MLSFEKLFCLCAHGECYLITARLIFCEVECVCVGACVLVPVLARVCMYDYRIGVAFGHWLVRLMHISVNVRLHGG